LGLVLAGLYAILRGKLVPAVTVDRLTQSWEARLAEARQLASDWREAHRLSETAREKQAETNREALEVARAAEDALKGFRNAAVQISSERRAQ